MHNPHYSKIIILEKRFQFSVHKLNYGHHKQNCEGRLSGLTAGDGYAQTELGDKLETEAYVGSKLVRDYEDTRRKQMPQKKKTRNVKTELKTKSVAKLDEDINRILEENPEDGDLEKLIAEEGKEFAGYSPPHTIRGVPFEEFKERQRQHKEQYEDT